MAADMTVLVSDLEAETSDLLSVLSDLTAADWARRTPSPGWTIRDQVAHLAYFDEVATLPAVDPAGFERKAAELMASGDDFAAQALVDSAELPGPAALAWFERARRSYLDAFRTLAPDTGLLWFGPDMSAASSVTARLMETWAHGQDVVDARGAARAPTARLRHVAHLGVRTLGWSFSVRGLPAPEAKVRVVLDAPDGTTWSWGPEQAADRVSGPALDFCLLVTQRRHRSRTTLRAVGPVADAWLDLAQCYAGPPGTGRPPAAPRRAT